MTGRCRTPGCWRIPRSPEIGYCETCLPIVLKSGRPPESPESLRVHQRPEWLRRAQERPTGLARDLTEGAA